MPISGILIRCHKDAHKSVAESLGGAPGLELRELLDDGTIVAVVDADTVSGELEIINKLLAMNGVMDVRLAYHNFEDLVTG